MAPLSISSQILGKTSVFAERKSEILFQKHLKVITLLGWIALGDHGLQALHQVVQQAQFAMIGVQVAQMVVGALG